MWEDSDYCWMVICKNHLFHLRQNIFFGHKIPLGETDAYAPPPALKSNFSVRCDDCRKEYLYKPSEVLRHEQELSTSFTPHPLFGLNVVSPADEMTAQGAIDPEGGPERRRSRPKLITGIIHLMRRIKP